MKDCPRCNFSKRLEFKNDPRTLKNPLFNVLNAYAQYDPQVNYGQGMNYLTANILNYMQLTESRTSAIIALDVQQSSMAMANEVSGPFDEVNAFYLSHPNATA